MILHRQETLQLCKQVEELLSKTYHTHVILKRPRLVPGRPNVCRFVVQEGPTVLGNSLVVKQLRTDGKNAVQTVSYPSARYLFFNDWAGLQFLAQAANESPLSPRFYAADRETEFMVMEDLKPDITGSTCLMGKDAQKAEEMLLLWGSILGKLHASTIGKQVAFNSIRDAIAPQNATWGWVPPWQRTPSAYEQLLHTIPEDIKQAGFESFQWMRYALRQATDALSITIPTRAEEELEMVVQSLRSPGPFLAYTHGDPCPDNCLLTGNVARLVDFENGNYRHALLDIVYARMCFPTCWSAHQLPHQFIRRIEQTYQAELVKGCPEAADNRLFTQQLVHASAYWVLMLCQFNAIPQLTNKDQSWGPTTMRQRILTRFELFAQTTTEFRYLETLGTLFHTMADKLRGLWPTSTQQLPLYPAFKSIAR